MDPMKLLHYLDWRYLFNGIRTPFSSFERKLLQELVSHMQEKRAEIISSNISEINRINWGVEYREVWYYKVRKFQIDLTRNKLLSGNHERERLLKGRAFFLDGETLDFNVWAYNSKFSHITFLKSAKPYLKREDFIIDRRK